MSLLKLVLVIIGTFILTFVGFIWLLSLATSHGHEAIEAAKDDVATDYEQQYETVAANGTALDRCVRAGFVAEAYLQAGNVFKYNEWKDIKSGDCKEAGLPQ